MSCPDPDTLATFSTLPDDHRAAIVDHAADCAVCLAVISSLLGMEETAAAAHPVAFAAPEMPPKIDRYTIERCIGAGAMGVVFAGYDPELARPVAVKVLRVGGSPERMRREAQALAKLTHPNVVAVYDVGDHDGSTFVTMALVDGENLRSWLAYERSTEQIIDVIRQAARGVDAAHRVGIVHRDLKPDNIFVARTGEVLVGDFGLARSAGPEARGDIRLVDSGDLTRTGAVVGTPAYMAPEQIDGDASTASDQFALCVTAWEALYGSRPFTGKSLGEVESAIRKGPPPEPRTRGVPSYVHRAIRRGLAADPTERHPSITAMLAALSPRRRRWPYIAAGLGVAGVATVATLTLREDPQRAALARCDALGGPATLTTGLAKIKIPEVRRTAEVIVARYAADWTKLAQASCVANAKHELSDPVYATTTRCLDRRAATFAWALAWDAGDTMLNAIEALEPIETCHAVEGAPPPSPQIAEFQRSLDQFAVLVQASPSNPPEYEVLAKTAAELGDEGALAETSYFGALARLAMGRDAEPDLRRAIMHADKARDDRIRARASAVLAAVIARAGRITEATTQRDFAASAAARSADPFTLITVERASLAIAFARSDVPAQLAALLRIESLQLAQFGEPSFAVMNTRLDLASVLSRADDPQASAAIERAATTTRQLSPTPLLALEEALLRVHAPAARLALDEQIVALARTQAPDQLPSQLSTLALDYELAGDFVRAYAGARDGLAVADPSSDLYADLLESAASNAFEIADRTDDKAIRARRLDDALAHIDRLPTAIRDADRILSLRGRVLFLQGHFADAVPPLTTALAGAEREDPPNAFRIATRAFALAQVLWEVGGPRERDRARALAEQAAARFPEARTVFAASDQYGVGVERVDRQIARLDTWRKTHR